MDEHAQAAALEAKLTADQANESAARAHHRLDGYNGQIRAVKDELAQFRVEHAMQMGEVKLTVSNVDGKVGRLQTRTAVYAGVGAFLCSAIVAPVAVALTIMYTSPATPESSVDRTPVRARVVRDDRIPAVRLEAPQRAAHGRVEASRYQRTRGTSGR